MNNSMIEPSLVELLKKAENRYTLVTVTSKRARQLIAGDETLLERKTTEKPLTIAINEVNEGRVFYEKISEERE
ncbi:DNA-directed RNA polymerase subunit omega [Clostridium grantii]|uniref:DNA-directed RNA polymerase subunit omega n=1 Tax=Clostridium grantii DSM 8605 TaxID=1121316 RepID=A0A1M5QSY0_9CLOT|nr:DNA-directed RNA polymerase subunit omega [Clostridium grantii]SHH17234.1 DNA-directed RNA polymerase subunit omega [Clostridium grantii DSM 8605]